MRGNRWVRPGTTTCMGVRGAPEPGHGDRPSEEPQGNGRPAQSIRPAEVGAPSLTRYVRSGQAFQVGRHARSVSEVAGELGCAWHTVNAIVYGTLDLSGPYRRVFELITPQATLVPEV